MSGRLSDHRLYIEIAGVIISLIYLYLSIRQHILLWPLGILSAVMYVVVYFLTKFYADMGLNVYYIFVSIYGWIHWSKPPENKAELPVTNLRIVHGLVLFGIFIILFVTMGELLKRITDSPIPYWDALTTAGSVVATWMLTRKILQHWLVWVVVDLISMGLYIYRGLYPTVLLFAVYTAMAVVGFLQWRKSMKAPE